MRKKDGLMRMALTVNNTNFIEIVFNFYYLKIDAKTAQDIT